ncbi:TM2 domain-containing protein [Duganella sp. LX47W]|uniref:TM2 domain-containing protein n=2 Tax=Rugamonas apoptosis TaxID=2758570 RepID=A0A7W2FD25_9BURK|nr:NINE protein [Rugamonas apoptosis]MBA5689482.1 TM2 domain-containing protein [Rugamonas apoptosis]
MTNLHQTQHLSHKNKTMATLLAFVLGGLGGHRLYLRGARDRWLWVHLASLPAAALVAAAVPGADWFYKILPMVVSALVGFLEALVLGLMPDEKWDSLYNTGSGRESASNWPLAVLLVATLMVGAGMLIATISRLFDLLYTGGAYG